VMDTQPIRYDVIDLQSGETIATFKMWRSAVTSADRRNTAYGSYRFAPRTVWAQA
jgi:hypothetical protein